jgi:hypothetical protein
MTLRTDQTNLTPLSNNHAQDHVDTNTQVNQNTAAILTKAPLASPVLTGVPIAPTANPNTNTTQLATTAYADNAATSAAIGSIPDATTTIKGKVQLAGDLGGSGSTATSPILKNVAKVFNVKDYGAIGNCQTAIDGAITISTNTFTSATANFLPADVGKSICIVGAGISAKSLSTTILSYISSTQVKLATNASSTVSGTRFIWGTDSASAFNNAAIDLASVGSGTIHVPHGGYYMGSSFNVPSNAIISGEGFGSIIYLPQGKSIVIDGKVDSFLRNIHTSSACHVDNDLAVTIKNSTTIRVQNCFVTEANAFGIFIQSTGAAICSDVWIEDTYCYGQGNADVIGGGPASGATGTVRDIHVIDCRVTQDISGIGGAYQSALDIVGSDGIIVDDNTFLGTVAFGFENMAKLNSGIGNNIVRPAIGGSRSGIYITANLILTAADSLFRINNNQVIPGEIKLVGDTTYKIKNVAISNNVITIGGGVDGMTLISVSTGTISGNVITGSGSHTGIGLSTSDTLNISHNHITLTTTGISDASNSSTNEIHDNTFNAVTTPISGIRGLNMTGGSSPILDLRSSLNSGSDTGYFRAIGRAQFGYDGTRVVISDAGSNKLIQFSTNNVARLNIGGSTTNGNIGFGITTPTAILHLRASTGTIADSPLKIDPGVLLTVPEDGSFEYDGSHIYGTIGTNRYQLDRQPGTGGTVTTISIANANGFSGSVINPTTTPAITLSTSIAGILKGNGTAVSAASAGTDYLAPSGNGSSLTGITESQISGLVSDLAAKESAITSGSTSQYWRGDKTFQTLNVAALFDSTTLVLLSGRSGGQTINGDTASGGNLTLVSTANATKGKILLGTSGYDEINNRLGIGTASPGTAFDVTDGAASNNIRFAPGSSTVDTASMTFRNASGGTGSQDIGKGYTINYNTQNASGTRNFTLVHGSGGSAVTVLTMLGGSTKALMAIGTQTPTATLDLLASATSAASLRIRSGVAPTSPNAGDIWYDGTDLVHQSMGLKTANGSLTLGTAGNKLNITTGSNASAGTGTLVGGTATISTTAVTANSLIFLTDTASSITNVGSLTVSAKTAGTSFVVTSTIALDTSTFNWLIIN